jgi:hypothetical protein
MSLAASQHTARPLVAHAGRMGSDKVWHERLIPGEIQSGIIHGVALPGRPNSDLPLQGAIRFDRLGEACAWGVLSVVRALNATDGDPEATKNPRPVRHNWRRDEGQ